MELKQWLNRGYQISKKLDAKKAYLESLGNTISNYEPREIDKDNPENSAETILIRWSELKKEADELERRLYEIDQQVDDEIRNIDNSNQYIVLFCRYVRRLSWDDIVEATGFSKSWVFALHREGVEDLERKSMYQDWRESSKK